MRYVTKFEIVDIGVDHPSYFQGFGVAFSDYDLAVIGIGDNAAEAYEDALEQMASAGVETDTMPRKPRGIRKSDKVPASGHAEDGFESLLYHVGIRYSATIEIDPNEDDGKQYDIVRYYSPRPGRRTHSRVQQTCLTLGQAKAHCNDPRTHIEGKYFDGYTRR